jgi:glycosyltransferase involved in cell wall biosynthesis
MKVLLVSYWFPPANTMAAVRIGKLARFLDRAGHDVRVLAARSREDPSLPVEVAEERVIRTSAGEAGGIVAPIARAVRRAGQSVARPGSGGAARPALPPPPAPFGLRRHYYALVLMPDNRIGWRRPALAAGRRLLAEWRPDIILASAPPFTGLFVARRLGREFGIPWVADYRDTWVDNPYNTEPWWRRAIDRPVERALLKGAAGIVTVTPLWSADLARQYGHEVATILNGYAEEDLIPPPPARSSDILSIVYTGGVYPGFRDPSPLFAALARLGDGRRRVEIVFYGPDPIEVMPLAERHAVADRVFVRPRVGHGEALRLQAAADVLLLMQWNDARDAGNIPGKFFEYLGARRPILLLGYDGGILAQMIRERDAGVVANQPAQLAEALATWIAQRPRGVPALAASVLNGLSRAEQYRRYEALLARLVARSEQCRDGARTRPRRPAPQRRTM